MDTSVGGTAALGLTVIRGYDVGLSATTGMGDTWLVSGGSQERPARWRRGESAEWGRPHSATRLTQAPPDPDTRPGPRRRENAKVSESRRAGTPQRRTFVY